MTEDIWENPKDKEIYELRKKGVKVIVKKPHKSRKRESKKIKVKCLYCFKVLLRIPSRIKLYKSQFCDRTCHALGKHLYLKSVQRNKSKQSIIFGKEKPRS